MMKRIESVDDARRTLLEQDRAVRAAYEGMDPEQAIAVATVSLQALAEQCSPSRPRRGILTRVGPIESHSVRC